jgi:hypothetical protein
VTRQIEQFETAERTPVLSASEIGAFTYCFVPMPAGPSTARVERQGVVLLSGSTRESLGKAMIRSTGMIHTSKSSAVRRQRSSISA